MAGFGRSNSLSINTGASNSPLCVSCSYCRPGRLQEIDLLLFKTRLTLDIVLPAMQPSLNKEPPFSAGQQPLNLKLEVCLGMRRSQQQEDCSAVLVHLPQAEAFLARQHHLRLRREDYSVGRQIPRVNRRKAQHQPGQGSLARRKLPTRVACLEGTIPRSHKLSLRDPCLGQRWEGKLRRKGNSRAEGSLGD